MTQSHKDPVKDTTEGGLEHGDDLEESDIEEDVIEAVDSDDEDGFLMVEEGCEEDDYDAEDEGMDGDDDEDMDDAVPVFEPTQDNAALYFRGHKDSVFCCQISKSGKMVVSGGKDDRGCVWDMESGELIMKLLGFSDSVTNVGFSSNEKYVAAADMAGKIIVWDISKKEIVYMTEVDEITWMSWHSEANVITYGTKDGTIWMTMIPHGQCKTMMSHGDATSAGRFMHDGKHVIAGYDDGSIRIWDLKNTNATTTLTKIHEGEVICVDINKSGTIIASGGMDGLKFSSVASGKVILSIDDFGDSVENVAFSENNNWLAAGSLDGTILIWDVSTGVQRHKIELGSDRGIVKIAWVGHNHILACCLGGVIQEYDARDGSNVKQWEGHKSNLLDISVNTTLKTFVCSSDDQTCGVFKDIVM